MDAKNENMEVPIMKVKAVNSQGYNEELVREGYFDDEELKRIQKMSKEMEMKDVLQNAAARVIYGALIIGAGIAIITIL